MTNEKPILFAGPMVRAIMEDRKTQTRRVIKPQPVCDSKAWACYWTKANHERKFGPSAWGLNEAPDASMLLHCPFGKPSDCLRVRETWRTEERKEDSVDGIRFAADNLFVPIQNIASAADDWVVANNNGKHGTDWRPSIYMPRWASRLTLEIVAIRVERLHEITRDGAIAEGCPKEAADSHDSCQWYRDLWDSINAKRGHGWDTNPWVWVVEFRRERTAV